MTQDLADFLRYERTMLLAAVARIDERLATMGPPTRDALPRRTPAAIVVVLRAHRVPMRVASVREALAARGREVEPDAVAQALCRLAQAGVEVRRVGYGLYQATEERVTEKSGEE